MDSRTHEGARPIDCEETVERGSPLVFTDQGLRLLGTRRKLIRYRDITHLALTRRAFAIGTVHDAIILRASEFAHREAMEALETALVERIAREPGGDFQLARMAELDHLARRKHSRLAVYGFVAVCLAALWLQWNDPFALSVGSFSPDLVAGGEIWRVLTANFLHHMFPLHLGLNLICILVIGLVVERVLGSWRTVVVMGVSGLAAMYACVLAGYASTVGASGVAAGLAGSLLCIEMNGSRRLPVWWRIPRRFFIGALIAQGAIDLVVPIIAGAAHLGGFAAGYLTTRPFVKDALLERPVGAMARGFAGAVVVAVAIAAFAASPLLRREGDALVSHGLNLLHSRFVDAKSDNMVAWIMVTESQPTDLGVQVAAALAERAVSETGRTDPDYLDTLAEALFVAGDIPGALMTIDEAIAISGESYFIEQRRRFTGERAADDRPDGPDRPWRDRAPRHLLPPPLEGEGGDAIEV